MTLPPWMQPPTPPRCPHCQQRTVRCLLDGVQGWLCAACKRFWREGDVVRKHEEEENDV